MAQKSVILQVVSPHARVCSDHFIKGMCELNPDFFKPQNYEYEPDYFYRFCKFHVHVDRIVYFYTARVFQV